MSDLHDKLQALKTLHEQGLITDEQYKDQQQALLQQSLGTTSTGTTPPSHRTSASQQGPSQIGAYKILKTIGEGGMGTVYRGHHMQPRKAEQQGGDVAIKVMHPQYAQKDAYRDRFHREAEIGLKLKHRNLVRVYDLVMDAGQLAMVMEWVDGKPLDHLIGTETGPIPWESARELFGQILDGVEHAHANGVIHRDLKPENVILGKNRTAKVLDFGIAKDTAQGRTKTGTGMGTVDYMAPEQYRDAKHVDHRADIYALGMTLYEMLAGRLPWDRQTTTEFDILDKKRLGNLPSPTTFYPAIPDHVVDVVMRAVAVEVGQRPQSIAEFRELLETPGTKATPPPARSPSAKPPTPASTPQPAASTTGASAGLADTAEPPTRGGPPWALLAAGGAIALAAVLFVPSSKDDTPPPTTASEPTYDPRPATPAPNRTPPPPSRTTGPVSLNRYITKVTTKSELRSFKHLRFPTSNLTDGDLSTCWQARTSSPPPQSEWTIDVEFSRHVKITEIRIANGCQQHDYVYGDLFGQNPRARSMSVFPIWRGAMDGNGPVKTYHIRDQTGWQDFDSDFYITTSESLFLSLGESPYRGSTWQTPTLSEIEFIGTVE